MKKINTPVYIVVLLNFINFNVNAQTYCSSKGISTAHGYIEKVSIETINNTSGNNGGYADFTAKSATLFKGATYTIELTPGFISGAAFFEYWTVYIDYNHDGVFETGEMVANGHNAIRINKSFSIPANALKGATRMRIQMQAGSLQTNPCAIYTYGEVEDYTVIINGNAVRLEEANSGNKNIIAENSNNVNLYPNPANNNLTVEFTGRSGSSVKISVYNLTGQKVINLATPSAKGLTIYNLNTGKLVPGFYVFELEDNGQIQHQKFLISR